MIDFQRNVMRQFSAHSGTEDFWLAIAVLIQSFYNLQSIIFVTPKRRPILPFDGDGLLVNQSDTVSFSVLEMSKFIQIFEMLPQDKLYLIKKVSFRLNIKNSTFDGMNFVYPFYVNGELELLIFGRFKRFSFSRFTKFKFLNSTVISILKTELSQRLALFEHKQMLTQLSDVKRDFLYAYQDMYNKHHILEANEDKREKIKRNYSKLTTELSDCLVRIQSKIDELKTSPPNSRGPLFKSIETECHCFEALLSRPLGGE